MTPAADLLDLNVWLALSAGEHAWHERARQYWHTESAATLAFCRVSALGLLRLLTNATVMDGQPLRPAQAWSVMRAWLHRPGIVLVPEPEGCDALLDDWVARGLLLPRLWTDAYLAAFALAGGYRLVTFDRDFARFPDLSLLRLQH